MNIRPLVGRKLLVTLTPHTGGAVMDAWDIGRVERLLAEVRSLAADVGAAGVRVVVGAAAEQLYRAGIGGDRTAGDLATALHAALQQPAADRAAA